MFSPAKHLPYPGKWRRGHPEKSKGYGPSSKHFPSCKNIFSRFAHIISIRPRHLFSQPRASRNVSPEMGLWVARGGLDYLFGWKLSRGLFVTRARCQDITNMGDS